MRYRNTDSILIVLRMLLMALGAYLAFVLFRGMFTQNPLNLSYVTLLGALISFLLTGSLANSLRQLVSDAASGLSNLAPQAVLASTVAVVLALLISVLLGLVLQAVPGYAWYHQIFITVVLAGFLLALGIRNQDVIPLGSATKPVDKSLLSGATKLLDTNVIIDGRIFELLQTGFIEGPLVLPGFVLRELQFFADQSDSSKRAKGRRGLDLLEKMSVALGSRLTVREFADTGGGVDDRLVRAALEMNAVIISNDNGLVKVAAVQGVRAVSLNALAEALKSQFGAGDEITVSVVKEGSQPGQGVAYLEDGTMVVIEDGLALKGRSVRVTVVSNIQTALGRMIFAKPRELV